MDRLEERQLMDAAPWTALPFGINPHRVVAPAPARIAQPISTISTNDSGRHLAHTNMIKVDSQRLAVDRGIVRAQAASALPTLDLSRRQNEVLFAHRGYDYAPTIIFDGGKYRMWWMGEQDRRDVIYYAESSNLFGSWSSPKVVFTPAGTSWYSGLTGDPSVIKVGSYYYMYFSGARSSGNNNMIGAARSRDGLEWEILNGGKPIVRPNRDANAPSFLNHYGAGQPSVVHVDGWYYMAYTDTTGRASIPGNGAGIYVIRSRTPDFLSNVQELSASPGSAAPTFQARDNSRLGYGNFRTDYRLLEAFSVDWQYSDQLQSFVLAHSQGHEAMRVTRLDFFNKSLTKNTGFLDVPDVDWTEGPGLIHTFEGHSLPTSNGQRSIPMRIVRPVGLSIDGLKHDDPERLRRARTWDLKATAFNVTF